MHAGFCVVPASQMLLPHLALTGADTLISEHGGLVWTDQTTIMFNDAWMNAHARRSEAGAVAPPAAGPGRQHDLLYLWVDQAQDGCVHARGAGASHP